MSCELPEMLLFIPLTPESSMGSGTQKVLNKR